MRLFKPKIKLYQDYAPDSKFPGIGTLYYYCPHCGGKIREVME